MDEYAFSCFSLNEAILKALEKVGYEKPTPIQEQAIPLAMEGKDVMACAQTGTGKTAAFALPMMNHLLEKSAQPSGHIEGLILTPTRELALQIDENIRDYGRYTKIRTTVILGGVRFKKQIDSLAKLPSILIATPGRLLDLMGQGHIDLKHVNMLVLDEADRMLDMGFIHDVRKIVQKVPKKRQTMLFSATLSTAVINLASGMLHDPEKVEVTPAASVSDNITQRIMYVEEMHKDALLTEILQKEEAIEKVLVFTRTKYKADRVTKHLIKRGIEAETIHSDKPQRARQKALAAFEEGSIKVLVATDIVARGIDVEGISHVINFEMPNDAESYVHRIGRTARAGAVGIALSFCDGDELPLISPIERLTKQELVADEDHPYHSQGIALRRKLFSPSASKASSMSRRRAAPRRTSRKRVAGWRH